MSLEAHIEAPMMDFIEFKNLMAFKKDYDKDTSWKKWLEHYRDLDPAV